MLAFLKLFGILVSFAVARFVVGKLLPLGEAPSAVRRFVVRPTAFVATYAAAAITFSFGTALIISLFV